MAEATGFCKRCKKQVMIRRKSANNILHFCLTIMTAGLWLIVWLLCLVQIGGWRCTACGAKTRKSFFG